MLELVIAFLKGMRNTLIPVGTFIAGFIVGLVLFGWWLTPLQFTDAGPQDLRAADHQAFYLRNLASLYAYDPNRPAQAANIQNTLKQWPEALDAICAQAQVDPDIIVAQQLRDLATVLDPNGCTAEAPAPVSSSTSFLTLCLYGLGLLAAVGLVYYFVTQRNATPPTDVFNMPNSRAGVAPELPPAMEAGSEGGDMGGITPIASYRTTFTSGNVGFDDSFSIETTAGDFLGECGVSISESIGTGASKAVTAMEVWLFDKNDIRTITKVLMSDHAYFDEAIRAKLSPKGEPMLARPDEVAVLETAALIVNAKITQMVYGDSDNLPDKSFFETFGVEISVWAKDNAPTGGTGSGFDDMF